jgi:hypothetical protein
MNQAKIMMTIFNYRINLIKKLENHPPLTFKKIKQSQQKIIFKFQGHKLNSLIKLPMLSFNKASKIHKLTTLMMIIKLIQTIQAAISKNQ